MIGFLLRMAISAFALWVASAIVPGMTIAGTPTLLAAALLLGLVNAVCGRSRSCSRCRSRS